MPGKPRIAYLASGAAGMFCGSCLRDNRLAATLMELGRDVVLMPLYTPLRTDEHDVSQAPIFYGGINVYLQQKSSLFRRLPRVARRALDSPTLLNLLSRFSSSVDARGLGAMTVSVLRGENGAQAAELDKLIDGLRTLQPDLIHLPNLPFLGVARRLKAELRVPIFCTLSGEDIFLDELTEPHRRQAFELIREQAQFIDAFVATTQYYARHCVDHFALPSERVHSVPMGIRVEDYSPREPDGSDVVTIGYLARICPEKGLQVLCEAFAQLCRQGQRCRLRVAGYLAPSQKKFVEGLRALLSQSGAAGRFEILGELTRAEKVDFLRSLDLFSVPSIYPEAKGLYVLESLACGVPVIEPRHGSFPELIEDTGGGVLYETAGGAAALAEALGQLLDQPQQRRELSARGRAAVLANFTDRIMAERTWALYERFLPNV